MKHTNAVKTVIVDDDLTTRRWLGGVVKKLGFNVVAEAANGHEGVQAVNRTQPDLVLLDVSMPVCTGPECLPQIIAAQPGASVVMLTSIADEETVLDCLDKGAVGYLRKDSPVEAITQFLVQLRAPSSPPRSSGGSHVQP